MNGRVSPEAAAAPEAAAPGAPRAPAQAFAEAKVAAGEEKAAAAGAAGMLPLSSFPPAARSTLAVLADIDGGDGDGVADEDEVDAAALARAVRMYAAATSPLYSEDGEDGGANISLVAFPEAVQKTLKAFDVDGDDSVSTLELARAGEMYANSKKTAKRLAYAVAGLVGVLLLMLGCIAGLVFAVGEALKDTEVDGGGTMLAKGSVEPIKTAAAPLREAALSSQLPGSYFDEMKLFKVRNQGSELSLNIEGWARIQSANAVYGSVVVLVTPVGQVTLDGTVMRFNSQVGDLFAEAGFTIQGAADGGTRRLHGLYELVAFFNSLNTTDIEGIGDAAVPTFPDRFKVSFRELFECDDKKGVDLCEKHRLDVGSNTGCMEADGAVCYVDGEPFAVVLGEASIATPTSAAKGFSREVLTFPAKTSRQVRVEMTLDDELSSASRQRWSYTHQLDPSAGEDGAAAFCKGNVYNLDDSSQAINQVAIDLDAASVSYEGSVNAPVLGMFANHFRVKLAEQASTLWDFYADTSSGHVREIHVSNTNGDQPRRITVLETFNDMDDSMAAEVLEGMNAPESCSEARPWAWPGTYQIRSRMPWPDEQSLSATELVLFQRLGTLAEAHAHSAYAAQNFLMPVYDPETAVSDFAELLLRSEMAMAGEGEQQTIQSNRQLRGVGAGGTAHDLDGGEEALILLERVYDALAESRRKHLSTMFVARPPPSANASSESRGGVSGILARGGRLVARNESRLSGRQLSEDRSYDENCEDYYGIGGVDLSGTANKLEFEIPPVFAMEISLPRMCNFAVSCDLGSMGIVSFSGGLTVDYGRAQGSFGIAVNGCLEIGVGLDVGIELNLISLEICIKGGMYYDEEWDCNLGWLSLSATLTVGCNACGFKGEAGAEGFITFLPEKACAEKYLENVVQNDPELCGTDWNPHVMLDVSVNVALKLCFFACVTLMDATVYENSWELWQPYEDEGYTTECPEGRMGFTTMPYEMSAVASSYGYYFNSNSASKILARFVRNARRNPLTALIHLGFMKADCTEDSPDTGMPRGTISNIRWYAFEGEQSTSFNFDHGFQTVCTAAEYTNANIFEYNSPWVATAGLVRGADGARGSNAVTWGQALLERVLTMCPDPLQLVYLQYEFKRDGDSDSAIKKNLYTLLYRATGFADEEPFGTAFGKKNWQTMSGTSWQGTDSYTNLLKIMIRAKFKCAKLKDAAVNMCVDVKPYPSQSSRLSSYFAAKAAWEDGNPYLVPNDRYNTEDASNIYNLRTTNGVYYNPWYTGDAYTQTAGQRTTGGRANYVTPPCPAQFPGLKGIRREGVSTQSTAKFPLAQFDFASSEDRINLEGMCDLDEVTETYWDDNCCRNYDACEPSQWSAGACGGEVPVVPGSWNPTTGAYNKELGCARETCFPFDGQVGPDQCLERYEDRTFWQKWSELYYQEKEWTGVSGEVPEDVWGYRWDTATCCAIIMQAEMGYCQPAQIKKINYGANIQHLSDSPWLSGFEPPMATENGPGLLGTVKWDYVGFARDPHRQQRNIEGWGNEYKAFGTRNWYDYAADTFRPIVAFSAGIDLENPAVMTVSESVDGGWALPDYTSTAGSGSNRGMYSMSDMGSMISCDPKPGYSAWMTTHAGAGYFETECVWQSFASCADGAACTCPEGFFFQGFAFANKKQGGEYDWAPRYLGRISAMKCCRANPRDNPVEAIDARWGACEEIDPEWGTGFVGCPDDTAVTGFRVDGSLEQCRNYFFSLFHRKTVFKMNAMCSSGLMDNIKKVRCCRQNVDWSSVEGWEPNGHVDPRYYESLTA